MSYRLTITLTAALLTQLDCIAEDEKRSRADVARLLICLGTKHYVRRRSLLCAGPRSCTRRDCDHAPRGPGSVIAFPTLESESEQGG